MSSFQSFPLRTWHQALEILGHARPSHCRRSRPQRSWEDPTCGHPVRSGIHCKTGRQCKVRKTSSYRLCFGILCTVHYISFEKYYLYTYLHQTLHLYTYYTNYLAYSLSILLHLSLFVLHLRNYSNFFFDIYLFLLHSNLYLHSLLIYIHLYIHNQNHNYGSNLLDFLLILMLLYLLLCHILSILLLHFLFHLLYNYMS